MTSKTAIFPLLLGVACTIAAGQAPAILKVELQNVVEYQFDNSDISKFATNPNITPGGINIATGPCVGVSVLGVGDIVAVNGQPARATYTSRGMSVCMSTSPQPWYSIADTTRNSIRYETYEILESDGVTPVGTVMTNGMNAGGPPPPGPAAGSHNFAIVGGTGAYLGARGQTGNAMQGLGSAAVPIRSASISEDPSRRRQNGGGHVVFTLYLIPMSWPTVAMTPNGPAVTHSSDFSLVSVSKPATAGEILNLFATGLGPTQTSLTIGQPFPSSPLAVVNSPVDVIVNGKPAEVLGAVGYPGSVDEYQVNFRVPPDTTKGTASIQVSAAWIPGVPVSIPVQ